MSDSRIHTMRSLEEGAWNEAEASALGAWYQSVRDLPLSDLSIGDVARSCRQILFPDQVVPLAIKYLTTDPLAGDLYDGELIVSLGSIGRDFWRSRADLRNELSEILARLDGNALDADLGADIQRIRKSLANPSNE